MPMILNFHKTKQIGNVVYIGRGSKYGNPFIIGIHGNRDEVCDKYKEYADKIFTDEEIKRDLGGKDLLCYCAPKRCHGDYLLERANKV